MPFHQDPESMDRMADSILRQAREELDSVFAMSEGMVKVEKQGLDRALFLSL